jgi:hypothetical protein
MTEHDKRKWGPGPWAAEPDRLEFRHRGVPCLLRRSAISGAWCGYAACEPGHPWHGAHYDKPDVDVHGGLTFAGECQREICHVPQPGEPADVYWLGFDCGHAFDFSPALTAKVEAITGERSALRDDTTYRDLAYAKRETEQLADQILKARDARTRS